MNTPDPALPEVDSMGLDIGIRIQTLFSPDDDTQRAFLNFVRGTRTRLRIADYALHMPALVSELIGLHAAGIDVALVLDSIQAQGHAEAPEVAALRSAGVPLITGTSEKHRIMHHKFAVRDSRYVLAGSWNMSESASLESNWFDIIDSKERAALFEVKWQEMWDWITAHEPQPAAGVVSSSAPAAAPESTT